MFDVLKMIVIHCQYIRSTVSVSMWTVHNAVLHSVSIRFALPTDNTTTTRLLTSALQIFCQFSSMEWRFNIYKHLPAVVNCKVFLSNGIYYYCFGIDFNLSAMWSGLRISIHTFNCWWMWVYYVQDSWRCSHIFEVSSWVDRVMFLKIFFHILWD